MVKRSVLAVGAAAFVGVLALAGCSSGGGGDSSADALLVYSPQGEGPRGEYIATHAKDDLGLDVSFVSGGGGELTERLLAERNNAQADVVLGLGEAQLNQVESAGVLAGYSPAWKDLVPDAFDSGTDAFTLFSQTPIVMAYNPAVLDEEQAPRAWAELAEERFANKFVFPSVTSQTGQAAVAGILWPYTDRESGEVSDEGWTLLTEILDNAVPVPSGQKFGWGQVVSGEQPIVVNWLGGIETGAQDNGLDLRVIDAEGGSPFVSTGIGLVAGSDRDAAAKRFIDWFGSAEVQADFVKETGSDTPVNPQALAQLPDAEAALAEIGKQDIDWGVVAPLMSSWLERIQLDILGR